MMPRSDLHEHHGVISWSFEPLLSPEARDCGVETSCLVNGNNKENTNIK